MPVRIVKATYDQLVNVQALLNEYYTALEIQKRDTPENTASFLQDSAAEASRNGIWLAYGETGEPVGCIVLRALNNEESMLAKLPSTQVAGEVKRLFVRQTHRGQHIADLLVDAVEAAAVERGMTWMYLDTKDDLLAAIKLYLRRGYTECERYNTNPQATMFLRKSLSN